MVSKGIDINIILTDPHNENEEAMIDLQLLNIVDKTVVDGVAVGAISLAQFAEGLKQVVINYANQFGEVDEYE